MEKQKVVLADRSADEVFLSTYINEALKSKSLPDRNFESQDLQILYNLLKFLVEKACGKNIVINPYK